MSMTIDSKKILQNLSRKTDRERVSLYLSRSIYDEFKSNCGEISASQVIEELMKTFSDSISTNPKK